MPHLKSFSKQSRNRGFTLLELLIVMTIIAMMVATVVLNVDLGRGNSELKDSARRLHAVMRLASEESVLFNKSLGLKFEEGKYTFYQLSEEKLEEDSQQQTSSNQFLPQAGSASTADKPKTERIWKVVEGGSDIFASVELPDYHEFHIFIEGSRISLEDDSFVIDEEAEKKKLKPSIFITADGEIFPDFEIRIQLDNSQSFASIKVDEEGELILQVEEGAQ